MKIEVLLITALLLAGVLLVNEYVSQLPIKIPVSYARPYQKSRMPFPPRMSARYVYDLN